jgi:hypothetical protein
LKPTPSIENTITGHISDIEELTKQKPDPPTRDNGNLDTFTCKTNWAVDKAVKKLTREKKLIIVEIISLDIGQAGQ